MKIQIFGARGMLGREVVRCALELGHAITTGACRLEHVYPYALDGDVVINCAGTVKQLDVLDSVFIRSNALGPARLAETADTLEKRVIHVSTDCVFARGGPHLESDVPDASDIYALSKRTGELIHGPHLTVRTSFVGFGPHGLVHDLQRRREVTVSQNLLWTGHTVDTVAKVLLLLAGRPHITGLLHIPGTAQNRYTLARDLKARWDLPAKLVRDDGFVADRRLASDYWAYWGLPALPDFETQLTAMRGPQ